MQVTDGDGIFTNCGLGLEKCTGKNPCCPRHDDFKVVRDNLIAITQKYSFNDPAIKSENGLVSLK